MTRLPLRDLQLPDGTQLRKTEELDAEAIKPLLAFGSNVGMVVASVAKPLRWFAEDEMRSFWAADAGSRIGPPGHGAALEDFPGERLYWASRWSDDATGRAVIVLEEAH